MSTNLPRPPITARRWIRMMLAFGISVALGMAPLLGNFQIPGFSSLLELFPKHPFDFTTQLIAATGLLMGVNALFVQYFQHEQISATAHKRLFLLVSLALSACLFLMLAAYIFNVEHIGNYYVLIGWNEPSCIQCVNMTRSECVAALTLATGDIDRCFGYLAVRTAALSLAFLYMVALSSLGALIGLLLLRERQ